MKSTCHGSWNARCDLTFGWWIVAVALTVSVLTGVVAGFIPALRAARMDPVDALRSE
jgi:putative ABC transport system permease protein